MCRASIKKYLILAILPAFSISAELAGADGTSHFLVGGIYREQGEFARSMLITVEGGTMIEFSENPVELPAYSVDLSEFWALPLICLPLQQAGSPGSDSAMTVMDLRYLPAESLAVSAAGCDLSLVKNAYIHQSATLPIPSTVLKWYPGKNEPELLAYDCRPEGLPAFAEFLDSFIDYQLFPSGMTEYRPELFRNSSLKEETASLNDGLPPLFLNLGQGADSLQSRLIDSLLTAGLNVRKYVTIDSMTGVISRDSTVYYHFRDIPALTAFLADSAISYGDLSDRLLVGGPGDWLRLMRESRELPLVDILSHNVREFYYGKRARPVFQTGSEASMLLFDRDPFEMDAQIVYIMTEGKLRYADIE